jgi:hypothetical protein
MKWYFCFNERVADWMDESIRACVTSAKRNTSLRPHCLYDGGDNRLVDWLAAQGVAITRTHVFFAAALDRPEVLRANAGTPYDPVAARGFYLPLQLPFEADDDYVLYTDTDVLFLKQPSLLRYRPEVLAAAPEAGNLHADRPGRDFAEGFNSGVMVVNLPAWRRRRDDLLATLEAGHFFTRPGTRAIYDQWALNALFKGRWETLDDALNWRAFWIDNPQAEIVHFHGPKPRHYRDFARDPGRITDPVLSGMLERHKDRYRHWMTAFDRHR